MHWPLPLVYLHSLTLPVFLFHLFLSATVPPTQPTPLDTNTELIFIIDCSGSMEGPRIAAARQALTLFLQSISYNVPFNIVKFGSTHVSLWPESRRNGDETNREARAFANGIDADMQGTHLMPVLENVLAMPMLPNCSRQLFVITDGCVKSKPGCLELVRKMIGNTRIYAIGISDEVDVHLVVELVSHDDLVCLDSHVLLCICRPVLAVVSMSLSASKQKIWICCQKPYWVNCQVCHVLS